MNDVVSKVNNILNEYLKGDKKKCLFRIEKNFQKVSIK